MTAAELFAKFYEGEMTFAELEAALRAAATDSDRSIRLLEVLEAGFSRGRLPAQLYYPLRACLDPAGNGASGTRLAAEQSPATDTDRTRMPDATRLPDTTLLPDTRGSGESDNADATLVEPADPAGTAEQGGTRITGPAPAADTTELDEATSRPDPTLVTDMPVAPDRTLRIPPPFPANDTGISERSVDTGRSAFATGSNWARPDQWTDRHTGPVGPGSVINNRFQIEEQLGKGGMGIVFKARDRRRDEARDANPYVAIKILSNEFRNHPQALVSLQREATKAQSLAHPNIVTVYDFDRDGTVIYMTMELLRGQSLSDYIRKSRTGVAIEDAKPIIEQMAEGLAYAHKRNIVHSDFKPGNVFLLDDDRAKILDFGIARATQQVSDTPEPAADFDAGDLGALTPGYASLEMFNGEPPDPADDVYALAVTAYQLLCGEHPFDRMSAKEAIVAKKQPRPIKGLSRRQWKTISDGLQLRREDRIPDAAQFLRRFRGPTRFTRYATAAIAVLALSAAYFAWQSMQAPGPDVPFDELPVAVQTRINGYLDEGDAYPQALANEAINQYLQAWDLHPRNPEIQAKLDEAAGAYADAVTQRLEFLLTSNDLNNWELESRDAEWNLDTWQQNEYLAKNKRLSALRSYVENPAAE